MDDNVMDLKRDFLVLSTNVITISKLPLSNGNSIHHLMNIIEKAREKICDLK